MILDDRERVLQILEVEFHNGAWGSGEGLMLSLAINHVKALVASPISKAALVFAQASEEVSLVASAETRSAMRVAARQLEEALRPFYLEALKGRMGGLRELFQSNAFMTLTLYGEGDFADLVGQVNGETFGVDGWSIPLYLVLSVLDEVGEIVSHSGSLVILRKRKEFGG